MKPQRNLLRLMAVVFITASVPLQAAETETLELGEGVYAFRYGDQQSLFLVGDDRVIATDPLSADAAGEYKKAIRKVSKKRITHVAYTSSFFNRVPGGRELAGRRAEFVAQENCKTNLEATPHPDAVLPTLTYSDQLSLDAGDASLDLYYFGQSYGTCLSVMIFKPANIMLVHGLVNPPVARVPDDPTIANFYLHNLIPFFISVEELAAAEGVEQIAGSQVIEGAEPLAPVTLIRDQRVFWDTLLRIVETEYNRKTPAQAIGKRADWTPMEGYAGYDQQHLGIMTRRIYSLYRIGR